MVDFFRSAEMSFLEAIVPEEALKSFAHRLAVLGCTEVVDVRRACVCVCVFFCMVLPFRPALAQRTGVPD